MVTIDVDKAHEPPPYTAHDPSSSSSTAVATDVEELSVSGPPDVARCNRLTIERQNDRITGAFVVDPVLVVPEALRAPVSKEAPPGEQPNLFLGSKHGSVDADIWVLENAQAVHTSLVFKSTHGSVNARLHTMGNGPCKVSASSTHGSVKLAIPDDFHGLLVLRTQHGRIAPLSSRIATIAESGGERRCFVGDLSAVGGSEWLGPVIDVTSQHGNIAITFIGDKPVLKPVTCPTTAGSALWSWLNRS